MLLAGIVIGWADLKKQSNAPYLTTKIKLGGQIITAEVVQTPKQWRQGLSGRKSLEDDKGMLFVFPQEGHFSFWMKGMNFPLDILWIKGDRVVEIVENAQPPEGDNIPIYQPSKKADKVLEVKAGFCQRYSVFPGERVYFLDKPKK